MNKLNKLKIFKYTHAGTTYTDATNDLWDYARDSVSIVLATTDYLYIGRDKPFNAVYVEMGTANTNATTLTAEYYSGDEADWYAMDLLNEETDGMTRNGFIEWDKNVYDEDWTENTVNSVEKFWIRIASSAAFSAGTTIQGMNLVFANDQDLKANVRDIYKFLPTDENLVAETSFILTHVRARDKIIQDIRNSGKYNIDEDARVLDIDQWDFHRIDQVREAAKNKALEIIYFNVSNTVDDEYWSKSKDFRNEYEDSMKLVLLSIDQDDTGFESVEEQNTDNSVGVFHR